VNHDVRVLYVDRQRQKMIGGPFMVFVHHCKVGGRVGRGRPRSQVGGRQ
jgi:hypothetical protein